MKDKNKTSITIENSIKNIGQKDWNACANQNSDDFNPFVSYEFLNALEESLICILHSGKPATPILETYQIEFPFLISRLKVKWSNIKLCLFCGAK